MSFTVMFKTMEGEAEENNMFLHVISSDEKIKQPVEEKIKDNREGLLLRLRKEPGYRHKFLTFLCLAWSFFILGWILGQFGPSFFDLQIITNTDLEEASYFYMSHNIGYLIGSLVSGALIGKCDCNFLLFVTMAMYGFSVFVIPWCFLPTLMLIAHGIRGLAGGLLDTVANSELLSLFGSEVSPYMQAMHFSFAVGGIASPLATAPFLAEDNCVQNLAVYSNSENISKVKYEGEKYNFSDFEIQNTTEQPTNIISCGSSKIFIPYVMSGIIAVSSSLSFLLVYLKSKRLSKKVEHHAEIKRNERNLPQAIKVLILTIMSIIFLLYTAMEDTVGAYLATFCVVQMNMTKTEASYVTATFWAFFAFGRLSGILAGKVLKSIPLVGVYSFVLMTSFLLLTFAPMIQSSVTVWVSTSITGIAMSILFPTLFTWTEEDFLLVTGKIASLFIMMSTAGSIGSPAALGYLIEEVTPMWYAFILLGESIGVLFFFGIAVILKKRLPQLRDSSEYQSNIEQCNENKSSGNSSPEQCMLVGRVFHDNNSL